MVLATFRIPSSQKSCGDTAFKGNSNLAGPSALVIAANSAETKKRGS